MSSFFREIFAKFVAQKERELNLTLAVNNLPGDFLLKADETEGFAQVNFNSNKLAG